MQAKDLGKQDISMKIEIKSVEMAQRGEYVEKKRKTPRKKY